MVETSNKAEKGAKQNAKRQHRYGEFIIKEKHAKPKHTPK